MGISFRKILSALVMLAALILAVFRTLPSPALPATAPLDKFSAERAIATIKAIANSPRLVGSPAYEHAKDYLLAQLAGLGLETELQETTIDDVSVENVLGRLEGSQSSDAILLSAHLDSVSNSPGATDNAAGVAVIIETLRALRRQTPLDNTVIVIFTGPEENCCYGAQAFFVQHPWAEHVKLVINVDAGGLNGPSILAATGPEAGWLIAQVAHSLPDPVGSSAIEALGSPATDYTLMFRKAGWQGFDFNLSWSKRIHSPLDNVDNLSPASLQHQGNHMLSVARRFGNLSLEIPKIPRPIYFDVLGLTLLYYPPSWAVFILLGVTLVFAAVIFVGLRRKYLRLRGIALGMLVFILSLLTLPVLLAILQLAIIQPSLSANPLLAPALAGDSWLSNGIRWGSAILTLLTTSLWYARIGKTKKVGKVDFALGTYLLLYLCAFGTTIVIPALSYLFVWPLLFGLIAMLIRFSSKNGQLHQPGWHQFLALLAAGVIAIVLFIPGILMALMSVDIQMIYLVPVFIVFLLGFLVPVFAFQLAPTPPKSALPGNRPSIFHP